MFRLPAAPRLLVAMAGLLAGAACAPPRAPVAEPDAAAAVGAFWPEEPPTDRWYPVAILVTSTGEIIVAENQQNRLYRMSRDGGPAERLASPSGGVLEWTALAAAPGLSFYALDGPGRVIHQYDLAGNYLGVAVDLRQVADDHALGSIEPAGFAVGPSGQAIVTDRFGDRILSFGPGWTFLGTWGQTGLGPGAWRRPGAVAADADGSFLIADEGNQRLVLLDPLGSVLTFRNLRDVPRGVAALERGRFAVSLADQVVIVDRTLEPRARRRVPQTGGCAGRAHATSAVGGDRDLLLVGEGCSGRLVRWSAAGG